MASSTKTSNHFSHWLSVIPFLIAIGYLLQLFPIPLTENNSNTLSYAMIGCAILFGFAIYSAQPLSKTSGQNYVHLAGAITLLTTGLANTLYIIIVMSVITVILKNMLAPEPTPSSLFEKFSKITSWISIAGIAAISEFVIYVFLFGQAFPYTTLTIDSLIFVFVTLITGNFISIFVANIISYHSFNQALAQITIKSITLFDLLLLLLTTTLAVILYQVNDLAFVIIIAFIILQVVNGHRVQKLKQDSITQFQEITTLNNVSQAFSVHLELNDVLHSIYQEIDRLVNANTIFVAFYNDENNSIRYPLVMQNGKSIVWHSRYLDKGLTDYVIRHKQSLVITRNETQRIQELGIQKDLMDSQAYIGIPMMIGEKIIGIIGLLNHQHDDILGTTRLNVIQSIVNQASLALRNASLYDRTTKLAGHLSHINRSVQDVMFNLNREEVLQAATTTALQITHGDQVAIFLLDMQDKSNIKLITTKNISETLLNKLNDLNSSWFKSGDIHRVVYDVNEVQEDEIKSLARIGQFRAFIEIPMKSGTTTIGYLAIYHKDPYQYSDVEIELLEMLTSQVTVALDNAELLQALELYASEQAELVHLSSITSSSLELETVIIDVCDALATMLKINSVEIGLYIQSSTYLHIYTPQKSGYLSVHEYNVNSYPEFQIDTNNLILYPLVYFASDQSISNPIRAYLEEKELAMLAVVPMIINQEVIGAILISHSEARNFLDNERRLIEMAASQITAQIHNAQIHTLTEEALVKRLEQLSLIEDIGQKISRSLDLDLIIDNVLEAALRSTQAEIASLALVKNEKTLTIKSQMLNGTHVQSRNLERPLNQGIMGYVIHTGTMRMIDNNQAVPEYVSPINDQVFRSSLSVPLSKGDTIIGVLNVESVNPSFFTEEHVGFIKSLAGHAIISIDNATLLDDHQQQIRVLSQLRNLALTASNTQTTSDMIYTVIFTTLDMLGGNGGILIPYNPERQILAIQETLGWIKLSSGLVQDMFFIPQPLLYQVVHTEDTVMIDNIDNHDRYRSYEQINQVNYKSIIIMPIKRRKQVTEVLCVTFKDTCKFIPQDRNTMQLLQVQVANHIENVMLSEEIRESNVRMRAILDSTRDGIILLDSHGKLQDANISAEQLLNVDLNRYRDQDFATVLINHSYKSDDDDSFKELIKTAKATYAEPERNHIREYTMQTNSKLVYLREVSSPVWDANNEIVGRLLSLRDVSEERALEEFRSRLQSMIVHDLRGPLGAIVSSMVLGDGLLQESDDEELVESLSQLMEVAQESASNLMDLVESMLDIGKLQRNTMDLQTSRQSIRSIAESAYMSLMASFKQANIEMNFDIPEDLPEITVDERLIGRVLINLIQNALKYTPEDGEILVTARIDSEQKDFIEVLISDTGPGIPEDHRERIFGEFNTIDEKTQKQQRGPRGQGLGLTFCKLAVEEHGGHIKVAHEGPLKGATFAFTLPINNKPSV